MQFLRALWAEVRIAFRRLAKAPMFLVATVATIAVGVGAASSIFALANGVLFRPLAYPEADRIVAIEHRSPRRALDGEGSSDQLYIQYQGRNRTLDVAGAYLQNVVNITDRSNAEQVDVALVTPSVFAVLGAKPQLGRFFTEDEGRPNAPTYVVISHDLWIARYGGERAIVGKEIELNGRRREIIGVAAPGFSFPSRATKIWYNLGPDPSSYRVTDLYLRVIGRIRKGMTLKQVEQNLQQLLLAFSGTVGGTEAELLSDLRVVAIPLKYKSVGDLREALLILLCAAGLLVLVALANVINLFLVRSDSHRRAIAVRLALGAGPGDIRRYWLSEALVVSVLGGVLGVAMTLLLVDMRFGFEPGQIPRLEDVRVDRGTMAFAVSLLLLTSLMIVGTLELRGRRIKVAMTLALGRATDTQPARQRAQRLLVGFQVALALVLLLASATAARGFRRVLHIDLGFIPQHVATQSITLPFRQYSTYADAAKFHSELLARIRQAPGVISAGAIARVPLTPVPNEFERRVVSVSGGMVDPSRSVIPVVFLLATPSYFDTMRIPILAGRLFEASDTSEGHVPVMISQSLARRLAGRPHTALGLALRDVTNASRIDFVVTGVVHDTVGENLFLPPRDTVYLPVIESLPANLQMPLAPTLMTTVERTAMDPAGVVASVKAALREVDPKLPLADIQSMEARVEGARARLRLATILLAVAAATTLFLGIVGIYGVTSYAVNRQMHEFGIRMALGATPSNLHYLIMGGVASVVIAGVGAGVALFVLLKRFLQSITFGVDPADAVTIAIAISLVVAVAFAACLLPAFRAGRSDPARIIGT